MKRIFWALSMVIMVASCTKEETMEELTERVFKRAAVQMEYLDTVLDSVAVSKPGNAVYPRSIRPDGTFWESNYKWWCSGFYPGTLWYVYEYTGNETFKELALKYQSGLEPLRYRTDDHDVGFQLMCSYGNCLRLTGDQECVPVLIDGANSLSTRFNQEVGCTRSWSFGKWSFPVIIDNMMNMELLLKATELGGDDSLKNIAIAHAHTTMKNHFRDDNSCFHLVDYDPETGAVVGKQTVQGYADNSAWARGQAWAIYAYPMIYRFTKDQEMLDHAVAIAEYLLPRVPDDGIPYWDYDAPDIPDDVRDASSAAIMACGLIELSTYVDAEKSARYLAMAEKSLRTLASDEYLAAEGENYGFLLKHSTGNKNRDQEVDVPLTYADYYFLEALMRWQKLVK
ncbi:MAG: glycoside hydrolase family 88 protein [Bacteroidales bacterium]|nr:glycoside hydrolase family 88 protein [Bacteroidales bacterium]